MYFKRGGRGLGALGWKRIAFPNSKGMEGVERDYPIPTGSKGRTVPVESGSPKKTAGFWPAAF